MKNILGICSVVMLILAISSCSPQKRLHRLLALHPELTTKETIEIRDSILIPQTKIDTFVQESILLDTVTIIKEKLSVQLHKIQDTIYLSASNDPDTIIIVKDLPVERIIYDNQPKGWFDLGNTYWLMIIMIILIIVLLLGKAFRRQ